MRIFHTADLHYCAKHLGYVDAAMGKAWQHFTDNGAVDAWVIAGDSFDATMGIHQPAFSAYLSRVMAMAQEAPGIVLQGTFSHDYPGALEPLKCLETRFPILVADEPGAWALVEEFDYSIRWERYGEVGSSAPGITPKLLAICVPSLNRADQAVRNAGPQGYIRQLAAIYRPIADAYRKAGVPVILVTHGTVTGCETESRHAMVSPDHEFSVEALEAFGADAVMLGHIHQHQAWRVADDDGRETDIVYAGSLAKLVYGHDDVTGYVEWDMTGGRPRWTHHPIPSRRLIDLEFAGPPDMDDIENEALEIKKRADGAEPVFVRVRWTIDEEHAKRVNMRRIREMLEEAGATVKLEPIINRIQSVRSEGIGRAVTMEDKLRAYLQTTGDEDRLGALAERLALAEGLDADVIVASIGEGRPG